MENQNFRDKYIKQNFLTRFLVKRFFSKIDKILGVIDFDNVLEVGCGEGFSTQYLKRILPDAHFEASDINQALVSEAIKRNKGSNIKFSAESICSLKRQDKSFDLIIALEILEHLENYQTALKELFRVSRKYVLISVPWEPWWRLGNMLRGKYLKDFGNTPGHINHWNKRKLKKILAQQFLIRRIALSFPWIIVLAAKNTEELIRPKTL